MSQTSRSYAAEARLPGRRDTLPPWVAALLLVFLVIRLYDVGVAPWLGHRAARRAIPSADLGTDAMQDVLQTDLGTKTAFLQTYAQPGTVVRPDPKALREALRSAEQFQRDTQNSPGAARRVILLRSLLNLPPLTPGKNGLDPLGAFTTALPKDTAPADRARYAAEGRLWERVFRGGRLTPNQVAAFSAEVRRVSNIRWWVYPALMALNTAQGDLSEASRYAQDARARLLPTLLPAVALGLARIGLMLLGALLLLYFIVRAIAPTLPGLWPTVPEAVPLDQRRLGVGDLMAVFVVYLLAREAIGVLLTGGSGFGVPHLHGLLTPFLPRLRALPSGARATAEVLLETAVYLLSALPPILYLWSLARRRGASLADEIGWSRRNLGVNLLYGLAGFAIASPLMLAVASGAARVAKEIHAPSPSNPAIPELISAPTVWVQLILILLATIAAPLVEELLFRGVLYNGLKLRFGVWPAIVLTGLIFGFVHPVGIAEMLAIATLGGVFAWMAETRKSLAPSIFAHFLNNMTTTLLLLFVLAG